jgi:hypothetical protein
LGEPSPLASDVINALEYKRFAALAVRGNDDLPGECGRTNGSGQYADPEAGGGSGGLVTYRRRRRNYRLEMVEYVYSLAQDGILSERFESTKTAVSENENGNKISLLLFARVSILW